MNREWFHKEPFFILRNKRVAVSKTGANRIIFCLSKFSKFKMKPVSVKKQTQSAVSAIKLLI